MKVVRHRHLSDARLIELALDGAAVAQEQYHLEACAECRARHDDIARMLADCASAATAEADAAFPAERLARQRTRILQRIEHETHPVRVIAFPVRHPHEPPLRSRPGMRWVAGAAAAGLVVGILAGHFARDMGPSRIAVRTAAPPPAQSTPAVALQSVSVTSGEEEFLGRLERAVQRSGGPALRPLDDLTPFVWEVAAR